LEPHRGPFENYPGFVWDFVNKPRRPASAPATKPYRCQVCSSPTPGEGLRLVDGRAIACECASPQYIERKRADGTITAERPGLSGLRKVVG
jgi:hypothetical protein